MASRDYDQFICESEVSESDDSGSDSDDDDFRNRDGVAIYPNAPITSGESILSIMQYAIRHKNSNMLFDTRQHILLWMTFLDWYCYIYPTKVIKNTWSHYIFLKRHSWLKVTKMMWWPFTSIAQLVLHCLVTLKLQFVGFAQWKSPQKEEKATSCH